MHMEKVDTIIIGGSLSGLYAGCLLTGTDRSFVILEARDRWIFGSIASMKRAWDRFQNASGTVHTVKGYTTEPSSWRLHGAMTTFIEKLRFLIPEEAVRLRHPVCRVERTGEGALVGAGELEKEERIWFRAHRVILALPPRLAAATILFEPYSSYEMTQAMMSLGTWMAGQAKAPFMNQESLLVGAILDQLAALFGPPAARAREPFTATAYAQPPMTEHPLYHLPDGRTSMWDGNIHFAGTEGLQALEAEFQIT